jgi:8-oxo-dGTP diphosphatase
MTNTSKKPTEVAVGVLFNNQGHVLFAQRPEGKPYAGWWEFPGGKIEAGESVEAALARELQEELGIRIHGARRWITRAFTYPHATVRLHFCKVFGFEGELQSLEQQAFVWRDPAKPNIGPILPAALPMLPWLTLPDVLPISGAGVFGIDAWQARLNALAGRWLLLREPDLAPHEVQAVFDHAIAWRSRTGGILIVSSRHPKAWQDEADGVHLTERDLLATQTRPQSRWFSASVHSRDALEHAGRIGCDFALLGPVAATASHPNTGPMGWDAFGRLVADSPIPVYALGGMHAKDVALAQQAGAQGIAAIRGS